MLRVTYLTYKLTPETCGCNTFNWWLSSTWGWSMVDSYMMNLRDNPIPVVDRIIYFWPQTGVNQPFSDTLNDHCCNNIGIYIYIPMSSTKVTMYESFWLVLCPQISICYLFRYNPTWTHLAKDQIADWISQANTCVYIYIYTQHMMI